MKFNLKNVFGLGLCLLGTAVSAQTNYSLPIQGLGTDNEGVFAHSIGPDHFGHVIPAPYNAFGNDTAYYFIASRDHENYDAASSTGMHGTGSLTGFPNLANALAFYSKSIGDINMRFAAANLGDDVKGVEWDLQGDTETRTYANGTFAILLENDTILYGKMPDLNMVLDYNSELTPLDDQISATSHYVVPSTKMNDVAASDSIAKAFYLDCKKFGLRFTFTSIQPAGQTELRVNETVGAFFEIPSGALETGSLTAPNLGDTITACNGSPVELDAGAGRDSYLWSNGSTSQIATITSTGDYYVTISDSGSTITSAPVHVIFDLCVGVNGENSSAILGVYPSPADDQIKFSASEDLSEVRILDLSGKVVMTQESITVKQGVFNTVNLDGGVYFIQAKTGTGEVVSRRFIKK